MPITSTRGITVQMISRVVLPSIGSASLMSYFSARLKSTTQTITDTTPTNTKVATAVSKPKRPSTSGAAEEAGTGSQRGTWAPIQTLSRVSSTSQRARPISRGRGKRCGVVVMAGPRAGWRLRPAADWP